MAQDDVTRIQDDPQYEELRQQGMTKAKAARIASANRQAATRAWGQTPPYEQWSRDELYERAKDLRIEHRSQMCKRELIEALRERRREFAGKAFTTHCVPGSR